MKYIDAKKLKGYLAELREAACRNHVDQHWLVPKILTKIEQYIDSLQQEQPMPDSTELIAKWEEEKDVLKQMDFRGDEWRLAQNAFMDGVGIGLSVKQEQPLTIEKVVEQCKKFGGNPEVIQQEQPEVDLKKEVEFICINKRVKMTIQELINYYIDTECAETAYECGF